MVLRRHGYLLILSTAILLSRVVQAASSEHHSEENVFHVPAFSASELLTGRRTDDLTETLRTTGLIALEASEHLHEFQTVRKHALSGLCLCTESPDFSLVDGTDRSTLSSDGQTTRTTFATATIGSTPLTLPEEQLQKVCGVETAENMDILRDYVARASNTFITALDELLSAPSSPLLRNALGGRYSSVSSIVKASSNLEHFHVYSKQHSTKSYASTNVLELHMDAGLFLAFVPGMSCNDDDENSHFLVETKYGLQRAVFPVGTIGIMLGVGMEKWLSTSMPLRATRHAVRMSPGEQRAWYGMMHLVPQNAIVQDSPEQTFADMRRAMVMTPKRRFGDDTQDSQVSIGCGMSDGIDMAPTTSIKRRRRLQHVEDASACNNSTNFYCWMSCLEIPQAKQAEGYINEGYSLYCLDPSVLATTGNRVSKAIEPCNQNNVPGSAMNEACMGSWQPTAPGVPAQKVNVQSSSVEEKFCYGGTTMYMQGFQWVDTTCVIYLFSSWVLSTPGAIVGACFGTLALGIVLEGVIRARRTVVKSMPVGWRQLGASTLFYGLQLTLGYFLMLVVMTYSGPLFVCVVVGLMTGHVAFNAKGAMKGAADDAKREDCLNETEHKSSGPLSSQESSTESNNAPCIPEGSTPCCQNTL